MLQRAIRKWFSGRRAVQGAACRPDTRARVGVEQLEGREAPSSIQFLSNVLAVGYASLNGTPSRYNYSMSRGSFYGTMAGVAPRSGTSLAEALASLNYSDYGDHS